jgi:hypothetical protein
MEALVAVETVLLVLLVVLVAGLLRSHAEILRRLGPGEAQAAGPPPGPASGAVRPARRRPAPPLSGVSPSGDALALDFGRSAGQLTLLAFLTSGCGTCAGFWETLAEPRLPDGVQTVIVARGSERESPARLRELAPAEIPVVMSSAAWEEYEVPGAPYFVLVSDEILGEGMAGSWQALASLVRDAVGEERDQLRVSAGELRTRRLDETLAAAGIGPGHPSLYPAGRPDAEEAES